MGYLKTTPQALNYAPDEYKIKHADLRFPLPTIIPSNKGVEGGSLNNFNQNLESWKNAAKLNISLIESNSSRAGKEYSIHGDLTKFNWVVDLRTKIDYVEGFYTGTVSDNNEIPHGFGRFINTYGWIYEGQME